MRAASIVMLGIAGCSGSVLGLQPKTTVASLAMAPSFELPTNAGTRASLATALAASDVVLVFYRGHW